MEGEEEGTGALKTRGCSLMCIRAVPFSTHIRQKKKINALVTRDEARDGSVVDMNFD